MKYLRMRVTAYLESPVPQAVSTVYLPTQMPLPASTSAAVADAAAAASDLHQVKIT